MAAIDCITQEPLGPDAVLLTDGNLYSEETFKNFNKRGTYESPLTREPFEKEFDMTPSDMHAILDLSVPALQVKLRGRRLSACGQKPELQARLMMSTYFKLKTVPAHFLRLANAKAAAEKEAEKAQAQVKKLEGQVKTLRERIRAQSLARAVPEGDIDTSFKKKKPIVIPKIKLQKSIKKPVDDIVLPIFL